MLWTLSIASVTDARGCCPRNSTPLKKQLLTFVTLRFFSGVNGPSEVCRLGKPEKAGVSEYRQWWSAGSDCIHRTTLQAIERVSILCDGRKGLYIGTLSVSNCSRRE